MSVCDVCVHVRVYMCTCVYVYVCMCGCVWERVVIRGESDTGEMHDVMR